MSKEENILNTSGPFVCYYNLSVFVVVWAEGQNATELFVKTQFSPLCCGSLVCVVEVLCVYLFSAS